MQEEIKIGGDLTYCVNNQESMIELNLLILILKTKICLSKSQTTTKKTMRGEVEIK